MYLIVPNGIQRKGKEENLNIKAVTVINPVTGWFEIIQYDDKREINVANLVEPMWLSIYPRPIGITYDQGE